MKITTLLILVLLSGCVTVENISPPPTIIPPSLTKEEAEYAIIMTLNDAPKKNNQSEGGEITNRVFGVVFGERYSRRQYWYYEGRGQNVIYAGYHNKKYYMRTEIKYSNNEIIFTIVDSRNLKQSENSIHKNALVWLSNLERNVRSNLGAFDRAKYEKKLQENKQK